MHDVTTNTNSGSTWSAVVVIRDAAVLLDACLGALTRCRPAPIEVIAVDDGSRDDSVAELAGWPAVHALVQPQSLGFGAAAQRGIAATFSPYVALITPEIEVGPEFARAALSAFAADRRLAAAELVALDSAGRSVPLAGPARPPLMVIDGPDPGGIVLRRDALDGMGGFDARFQSPAYSLADLSLRLQRAGSLVTSVSDIPVQVNALDLGRETVTTHGDRVRFAAKHLTPDRWWYEFVPAEIGRLRAALQGDLARDWPDRSGGAAVEALARHAPPARSLLDGSALLDAARAIASVRESLPVPHRPRRRLGRRAERPPGPTQEEFNAALIRVVDAQDRLNREIVADLIVVLLDLVGAHSVDAPGTSDGVTADPDRVGQ
ncbi:MAG TPA: glycosyltransferase [Thermomicrobiaceae bacterium]|nr:glycosyltransferase [Thermomicrobiaceae bacterium]